MILGIASPNGLNAAIEHKFSAANIASIPRQKEMFIAEGERFRENHVDCSQYGSYCNLISTDEKHVRQCIEKVIESLQLADAAGCRCVVVGGGHRDPNHPHENAVPHPDNWTDQAIDLLAEACTEIIDRANTQTAKLSIETWVMTSMNNPQQIRRLVEKVNDSRFGVLFDPVNLMTIDRYFRNGDFMKECFEEFGQAIINVHAKDTFLSSRPFTYHMSEVPIGEGNLDYPVLLELCKELPRDTPLIIEHVKAELFQQSADFLKKTAEVFGKVSGLV